MSIFSDKWTIFYTKDDKMLMREAVALAGPAISTPLTSSLFSESISMYYKYIPKSGMCNNIFIFL